MRILSFDIEEWFHLLEINSTDIHNRWDAMECRIHKNMEVIFDSLEKHNIKATFFVIGWICEKYPELIRQISAKYEIASHSMYHKLVYTMTPQEFKEDLHRSIATIEDLTGKKVRYYRAPGLSIHNEQSWAFEIMAQEGIDTDSSIANTALTSYGHYRGVANEPFILTHNGMEIKEFPVVSKYSMLFSAGGYFRFMPYWIINRMTKNSDYVMAYFHPRDFDYEQPMLKEISLIRKFKSYYGLLGMQEKFEKWLSNFEFVDIGTAEKSIDWTKAIKVKI